MNGTTQIGVYSDLDPYNNYNIGRWHENVEPYLEGHSMLFIPPPGCGDLSGTESVVPMAKSLTDKQKQTMTDINGMKILSNCFKGISLSDIIGRTTEVNESFVGWKQILPGPAVDFYVGDASLNVTYSETKNLDVVSIHYAWMQYIEAVRSGLCSPVGAMASSRLIDYMTSIFFIVTDFDMHRVLFFARYGGVYPVGVPISQLTSGDISSHGFADISITYAYQYKDIMTQGIIEDFNTLFSGGGGKKFIDMPQDVKGISSVGLTSGHPVYINFG